MARVAYVKEKPLLAAFLSRAGYGLMEMLDAPGAQGFVAESATTAVLAFRGTETDDPEDLVADAKLGLTAWSAGGQVHSGFAAALVPVWGRVQAALPKGKRWLFTGHSLGAGLATLAATLLRPDVLYSFGSPRVGDAGFAGVADQVAHERYVDCCDRVCRLPPELLGYRHSGKLSFIDRSGRIRLGLSQDEIDQERSAASSEYRWRHWLRFGFLFGNVAARGLADHAPLNYSTAVLGVRQGD
jgi:hypothetical protein